MEAKNRKFSETMNFLYDFNFNMVERKREGGVGGESSN